uniref:FAM91 N-terminal domain-containing protein n=1 Tax=Gorilla gorilla gorilla TaxID=9595 RepID=A0A2I2ZLA6_GORGO
MNIDVEFHIRHKYPWKKLPANVRHRLGNSQREYENQVVLYSICNQYYEELLKYSRDHLMLYPYHLSDIMVKGCLNYVCQLDIVEGM